MVSVFAQYEKQAWPYVYQAGLLVGCIAGGTPTNAKVAEGWIKSKGALGPDAKDDLIRAAVAETMAERGVSTDEAIALVADDKTLNGFKRDPEKGLFVEGRQVKAAIKEAASVAGAADKLPLRSWGKTNKGLLGFIAEHVCVVDDRIYLGRMEETGVNQRFVHTFRGSSIQYEEYVTDAQLNFTVKTDYPFTREQWAMIWLTGQEQGVGSSRSQGFGRYEVTQWDAVE